MQNLRGKGAIVTGAASGIGLGLAPAQVAGRVLRAIRDGEFYIFTHAESKPKLEARFGRILDAFEKASA